ncbi:MAG: hypothetical protein K8823_114 [Cenarchaeum symbiont of Oopsacas minuta]|nr:hypothetical protein [Cenarchaeum symbiont of Oopsacas minuta]
MSLPQNIQNYDELDFHVISEDYTRYRLDDRTVLKIKLSVQKMFLLEPISSQQIPNIGFAAINLVNAIVPKELKKFGRDQIPIDNANIADKIGLELIEEIWQEYHTMNGYRIRIRPVITQVSKYKKYNNFGEPVYSVPNIQQITDVEKL